MRDPIASLHDQAEALLRETTISCHGRTISAAEFVDRLEAAGVSVFLSGGTVRDLLLGRRPSDVDLIGTAPIATMAAIVEREFGADWIDILNEPLGLLRFGSEDDYIDLNMFRDIESARRAGSLAEVKWDYSGRPESDALTTDFTMNAMYWHPAHGLVDPLGGLDDCLNERLVISADPHKAAIDPKLAFRLARFACLGFRPTEPSLAFFRSKINVDTPRYGPLLGPYLHELTRGSPEVKQALVAFCEMNGANRHCVDLIAAAVREEPGDHRAYATSNSASPLAT
jgi:Poly A polymerase head domain